ncbi:DUF488 domain-containing protein [Novosphingobium sp. BL-8H]|uniref:DUF488 domain-containing protein n=1 Tax=Novosphingobium sp. BL-8H TaxID=3127640 RepID=UPI0037584D51
MSDAVSPAHVRLKRIYEQAAASDGLRFLVDRLWPRGISKERAALTEWVREIAPSTELRKWFGHDPDRWNEFQSRYRAELAGANATLDRIRTMATGSVITLLYAARDQEHNEAVVLRMVLLGI